jgi:hypothetical protein
MPQNRGQNWFAANDETTIEQKIAGFSSVNLAPGAAPSRTAGTVLATTVDDLTHQAPGAKYVFGFVLNWRTFLGVPDFSQGKDRSTARFRASRCLDTLRASNITIGVEICLLLLTPICLEKVLHLPVPPDGSRLPI